MSFIHNHKLKIILSLALLLSLGLSVYSLANVDTTNTSTTLDTQWGNRGGGFNQREGGTAGMAAPGADSNAATPGTAGQSEGTTTPDAADSGSQTPGVSPDGTSSAAGGNTPSGAAQGDTSASDSSGERPARGQGTTDGSGAGFTRPSGGGQMGGGGMGGNSFGGASASRDYGTPLAWYAVIFAVLFIAAFYYTLRGKLHIKEHRKTMLVGLLLAIGLCLKLAAAPWISGYQSDINFFKTWATQAADSLSGFYLNSTSDYPPLYMYVLYLTGKIVTLPAATPYFMTLIKLPSILADTATAYLLYKAARRYFSFETGLLIAAFYMFNPAVLINATFWGQVDSFFTLIVVSAIWLLCQRKYGWATAVLTLSVLMKPQGIIYVPVLFFATVRSGSLKAWLKAAGAGILTLLIVVLPFSSGQSPLWLYTLYTGTVNEYPFASVNAYNLFALLGDNYTESSSTLAFLSYHDWGMIFIVLTTLFTGWMYLRSKNAAIAALGALLQIAGVFTLSSSMHERYLFPAAALTLLAYTYWRDKRLLWLVFGFSTTIFLNTYAVYYGTLSRGSAYNFTMFAASLLNLAMCVLLVKIMWDLSRKKELNETQLPAAAAVSS
ncbi:glycosyltransferase family 39 protein [Paenibacillus monticola]|uniref:Dolichyl pyrophosphate Man9GlcNAc2 alpha-1,3-glucosyltransferase n=1 Tax=Paenibacillus monticola TaxID=2666075 RepID=A0A7X2L3A1_9BACL|nr:glycosyltransferase family 39 protein [Paenibacillus monticola]MRN54126.1 dolichyl pyrophosphate Man9GlcNAc2 alpha-1,3-glucosyltransferase [Paenibacillus monticola]